VIELKKTASQIRFKGFTKVPLPADTQRGPTCGFEAIETIIQLFHGVGNDLTERELLPWAHRYGAAAPIAGG
jgi:hypothetical protein